MSKYSEFIGLSDYYESVVDIDSDKRNPAMWRDYIVHDDMTNAIARICDSFKFEDKDKRRSFWLHGTYGTGKTYAGIVIKHLLEDKLDDVEEFFNSKAAIRSYLDRFKGIREKKGDYLVIWRSGVAGIETSTICFLRWRRRSARSL